MKASIRATPVSIAARAIARREGTLRSESAITTATKTIATTAARVPLQIVIAAAMTKKTWFHPIVSAVVAKKNRGGKTCGNRA